MPTSPPPPPESPDIKRPRLIQTSATYPPPFSADPLSCPRCNSTATKFCYYNNYNLSQPRHFCKGCRRYWTRGGTLRDVPVGGGTRKSSKRAKLLSHRLNGASPSNSSSSSSLTHETAPNKPTSDSAVEKPELPSVQQQQQLLNLNDNITGEGELSFSSMLMMNDNNSTPGFLSLGGYGYGSGFVHGFQQGYGYGTRASGVDFPAEMSGGLGYGSPSGFLYGAPVAAAASGFDINMWQMAAVADHGGQGGGGLVDLSEIQILNSTPALTGGGALKEEKVADSSTSACLDSLHLEY